MTAAALRRADGRRLHGAASIVAALLGSLCLLFFVVPIAQLVAGSGAAGARRLFTDAELRSALWLTAVTATSAVVLGVAGGTPLAYLLARGSFRGRAVLAAVIDLPLLIPHPVAGIALLLLLGRESALGRSALAIGLRVVGSPIAGSATWADITAATPAAIAARNGTSSTLSSRARLDFTMGRAR